MGQPGWQKGGLTTLDANMRLVPTYVSSQDHSQRTLEVASDWLDHELQQPRREIIKELIYLRLLFSGRNLNRAYGGFLRVQPTLLAHAPGLGATLRKWFCNRTEMRLCDPLGRSAERSYRLPHTSVGLDALRSTYARYAARHGVLPNDVRVIVRPKLEAMIENSEDGISS